jgi:hypothetical protein
MIGRFTESALLAKAKDVVEEKSKASSIFDEDAEKALPRFKMSGKSSAILCSVSNSICSLANYYYPNQIHRAQAR